MQALNDLTLSWPGILTTFIGGVLHKSVFILIIKKLFSKWWCHYYVR